MMLIPPVTLVILISKTAVMNINGAHISNASTVTGYCVLNHDVVLLCKDVILEAVGIDE